MTESISPENALYTVIEAAAEAAEFDAALKDAEVHPTVYARIREEKTVRVGNCESEFAPVGELVREFDANITLQLLARVEDGEDAETYPAARDTARAMTVEVIGVLLKNTFLNGAVCDLQIRPAFRGWATVESAIYAVVLLPLRLNPSGKYE